MIDNDRNDNSHDNDDDIESAVHYTEELINQECSFLTSCTYSLFSWVSELLPAASSGTKLLKTLKYTSSVSSQGRCGGHGLDPVLVAATIHLVGTAPATHFIVTFQNETDECLVSALSAAGVAIQLVRASHLWETLHLASYTHPFQCLLVGDVPWITTTISQVENLYLSAEINALKTYWFWVLRNLDFDASPAVGADVHLSEASRFPKPVHNHSSVPESLPLALPFMRAMAEVEGVLFEGLQGILISPSRRGLAPTVPSEAVDQRVLVAGVDAPGDGSWRLKLVAAWTTSGFQVLRPLWPKPAFNLQGRTLRINCLKKPTVFLFNDGDHLAQSRGYAADMMHEIQKRLNFTDVLVPNTGFGAYRNGSWNGMVGDLLRQSHYSVSLSSHPPFVNSST
ncbi:uncharacterized protein [Panulirus ornatus]|uniref:uncharacterized protein n=1 Tax=Panulirus ornatus TaxID=150431 RepID=UPI003A87C2D6